MWFLIGAVHQRHHSQASLEIGTIFNLALFVANGYAIKTLLVSKDSHKNRQLACPRGLIRRAFGPVTSLSLPFISSPSAWSPGWRSNSPGQPQRPESSHRNSPRGHGGTPGRSRRANDGGKFLEKVSHLIKVLPVLECPNRWNATTRLSHSAPAVPQRSKSHKYLPKPPVKKKNRLKCIGLLVLKLKSCPVHQGAQPPSMTFIH